MIFTFTKCQNEGLVSFACFSLYIYIYIYMYVCMYVCMYACFSFDFLIEYNKRLFVIVYGIDEMLELYWV